MSLNMTGIRDAVVSHALQTGYFDSVNAFEPKSAPQTNLSCSVWFDTVTPLRDVSGLASVSVSLVLNVRIYLSMLTEPQDDIDTRIGTAVEKLMNDYAGDFDLASTAMAVDLLGMYGSPMAVQFGYVTIDNKMFRAATIKLPIVVSDVWTEVQ